MTSNHHDPETSWSSDAVRSVADLLARRWVLDILAVLDGGPLRRTVLRERIGSVSDKVLTDTLRHMERRGLITREMVPAVPIEVDYELTPLAQNLQPLLQRMEQWAHRLDPASGGTPRAH
jgi:DNA-binding HxlR family transcriptional regulator